MITRVQFHSNWESNSAYIHGLQVPAGQIWYIQFAGLVSNDSALVGAELQVEEPVLSQNNVMYWAMPAPASPATSGTPKVELLRPIILVEGQRIAGRTTSTLSSLALLYSGFAMPDTWLGRLLGVEAPPAEGAPDLTNFKLALEGASAALQVAANNVP